LTAEPATAYAINRHNRQIAFKGNVPTLSVPVPAQDKLAMTSRLAECNKLMTPLDATSERTRLAWALSRMLAGFNDYKSIDVEMTITTYVTELSSLPFWSIESAIFDIQRGRVEGLSPDFRPTTARIYQIAEEKLEKIRVEKARIEIVLKARVEDSPPRDPQELLRIEAQMKTLVADLTKTSEAQSERDDRKQKENTQRALERNYNAIRAEYLAYGFEPIHVDGKPMCLSLARAIGAKLQPLGEPLEAQSEFQNKLRGIA
jgi:hypothetical protein